MAFHNREGKTTVEAASDRSIEPHARLTLGPGFCSGGQSFLILDDLETDTFDVIEPADFWERARADGYRSMVLVRRQAREQQMALGFWSKRPHAFDARDVAVAQRIADHVALAISHEQLADAARQAADARTRAERLEVAGAVPDAGARHARRLRPRRRTVEAMEGRAEGGGAGVRDGHHGAADGRVRHRERGRRPLHPSCVRSEGGSVRGAQLCRPTGAPSGGRAVRIRARRLYRRPAGQARTD